VLFKFDVIKEMEKQSIQQPLDLVDGQLAWDFLEADVYGGGREDTAAVLMQMASLWELNIEPARKVVRSAALINDIG
jgi:hypothetical protein